MLKPPHRQLCLGFALLLANAANAATPALREVLMPPSLAAAMRCTGPRYLYTESFMQNLNIPRSGAQGKFTAQQVREMVDGVDTIVERFCREALPLVERQTQIDIKTSSDIPWKGAMADEKTMQWLRLNSLFLAEIESIHLLTSFGSKLMPANEVDLQPAMTPELEQVLGDAVTTSFTDEERDARITLHFFGKTPRLAALLPSRFDVARLARIEETNRTLGASLLHRYYLNLRFEQPKVETLRKPTEEEAQQMRMAQQRAAESIAELARKYALPYADRNK